MEFDMRDQNKSYKIGYNCFINIDLTYQKFNYRETLVMKPSNISHIILTHDKDSGKAFKNCHLNLHSSFQL